MNRGKRDLSSLPNAMQESVACSFHLFSSSPMIQHPQTGKYLPSSRLADKESNYYPGSQEGKALPAHSPVRPSARAATPCFSKKGHKKGERRLSLDLTTDAAGGASTKPARCCSAPHRCEGCCLLSSVLKPAMPTWV